MAGYLDELLQKTKQIGVNLKNGYANAQNWARSQSSPSSNIGLENTMGGFPLAKYKGALENIPTMAQNPNGQQAAPAPQAQAPAAQAEGQAGAAAPAVECAPAQ